MSNIFLQYPFPCSYKYVECEENGISCSLLHDVISTTIGFSDFSLYCNGKKVPATGHHVLPNSTVHVSFSLPGGKGGFGSMLRAIGAQIEKTTNREACRDLSGRRLRDINEEQRLKNWISKKGEREAEKIRRRKERLERLKSRPKHNFVDFEYEREISELPERIDDALSAGIEKAKKRPSELSEPSTSGNSKKKRLWLDEDISESSGSDSDLSSPKSNEGDHLQTGDGGDSSASAVEIPCNTDDECSSAGVSGGECSASQPCPDEAGQGSSTESQAEGHPETANPDRKAADAPLNPDESAEDKKDIHPCSSKSEEDAPVDLDEYRRAGELEELGLERLKGALMLRGLKCGGSLADRAERLWAVRGLSPDQYPKNLLAKQNKK